VQHGLTDAVAWAIAAGIADASCVAIMAGATAGEQVAIQSKLCVTQYS
jgi:hypothetical protein